MAIEAVLSIRGRGTVVTGVFSRGTVKISEEIEIVGIKNTQTATVEGVVTKVSDGEFAYSHSLDRQRSSC